MTLSQTIYNFLYNSLDGSGLGKIPIVESARRKWISNLAKNKVIKADYGASLEIDEYDSLSLLRTKNAYEPDTRRFISDVLCKHKGVAIDAGANIGYFTVLMSQLADKVYAFEPNNLTRSILDRNITRNNCRNVVIDSTALSSSEGAGGLYGSNQWAGANSLLSDGHKPMQEVKTDTLDRLIKEENITLIKMDIEGSELDAIKGATKVLSKCKYLVVEYNADLLNRTSGEGLIKKIIDSGFTIENMQIVNQNGGNLFCHKKNGSSNK